VNLELVLFLNHIYENVGPVYKWEKRWRELSVFWGSCPSVLLEDHITESMGLTILTEHFADGSMMNPEPLILLRTVALNLLKLKSS